MPALFYMHDKSVVGEVTQEVMYFILLVSRSKRDDNCSCPFSSKQEHVQHLGVLVVIMIIGIVSASKRIITTPF